MYQKGLHKEMCFGRWIILISKLAGYKSVSKTLERDNSIIAYFLNKTL